MSEQRFSEVIQARLTWRIFTELKRFAEKRGQTISAVIRDCIVRELERQKRPKRNRRPVRLVEESKILKKLGLDDGAVRPRDGKKQKCRKRRRSSEER